MTTNATAERTSRELLNREQAADYLGLQVSTLAAWASSGRYKLPMVRVGRAVRYRRTDLDRWMTGRTVTSTAQAKD